VALACLVLAACLAWSYWPILVELRTFWSRNEDYSAGQLVPLAALYLVWRDRRFVLGSAVKPSAWGIAVLLAAELIRAGGVYYGFGSAERFALVVAVVAAVLLAAGRQVAFRLKWVLAFLVLMLPPPARLHEAIALPLQHHATTLAAVALESLGFFVIREGHVLRIDDQTTIGVSEACSGLRMLTAFVFVCVLLTLLVHRRAWQKVVLLLASVPIAVVSNAARSVATALFVYYARDPSLSERFHDLAGLAMMPLGVVLALGLLRFMRWLDGARERVLQPASVRGSSKRSIQNSPATAKERADRSVAARRVGS
jgi:exosortase